MLSNAELNLCSLEQLGIQRVKMNIYKQYYSDATFVAVSFTTFIVYKYVNCLQPDLLFTIVLVASNVLLTLIMLMYLWKSWKINNITLVEYRPCKILKLQYICFVV